MASAAAARRPPTPAQKKEVRVKVHEAEKLFRKFDTNGSGGIGRSELRKALVTMFNPKLDCCIKISDAMLDEFLPPGRKVLNMAEFSDIVTQVAHDTRTIESSVLGAGKQLPFQEAVHDFYKHPVTAGAVALIIMANFVINIVEKEIDPDANDLQYPGFWYGADTFFNIIFIFELWANVWGYGGPVKEWITGWNIFDTIIVTVGVMTMANVLGPPFDKLKLMRAFRVFRLFKRVKELNQIIVSLIKSIPAVFYAFVVMFIFFAIYAILAVELFRDFGAGGYYETFNEVSGEMEHVNAMTPRGYVYGIEYYGTFSRALYTLFQVQTGESWSEAVARPVIFGGIHGLTAAIFFITFVILMQMVLVNVVVAVLLDSFSGSPQEDAPEEVGASSHAGNEFAPPEIPAKISQPPMSSPPPKPSLVRTPTSAVLMTSPKPVPVASSVDSGAAAKASLQFMSKMDEVLGKLASIDTLGKGVADLRRELALMQDDVSHMKKEWAKAEAVSLASFQA